MASQDTNTVTPLGVGDEFIQDLMKNRLHARRERPQKRKMHELKKRKLDESQRLLNDEENEMENLARRIRSRREEVQGLQQEVMDLSEDETTYQAHYLGYWERLKQQMRDNDESWDAIPGSPSSTHTVSRHQSPTVAESSTTAAQRAMRLAAPSPTVLPDPIHLDDIGAQHDTPPPPESPTASGSTGLNGNNGARAPPATIQEVMDRIRTIESSDDVLPAGQACGREIEFADMFLGESADQPCVFAWPGPSRTYYMLHCADCNVCWDKPRNAHFSWVSKHLNDSHPDIVMPLDRQQRVRKFGVCVRNCSAEQASQLRMARVRPGVNGSMGQATTGNVANRAAEKGKGKARVNPKGKARPGGRSRERNDRPGIFDPIDNELYIGHLDTEDGEIYGYYAVQILPLRSLGIHNLPRGDAPKCYQVIEGRLEWAEGYEVGGPHEQDRTFLANLFTNETNAINVPEQHWVEARDLSELNFKDPNGDILRGHKQSLAHRRSFLLGSPVVRVASPDLSSDELHIRAGFELVDDMDTLISPQRSVAGEPLNRGEAVRPQTASYRSSVSSRVEGEDGPVLARAVRAPTAQMEPDEADGLLE